MAIRIANLMKTEDWVWDQDPDLERPSVFKFRYLDAYEMAYIQDLMTQLKMENLTAEATEEDMRRSTSANPSIFMVAVEAVALATVEITPLENPDGSPTELKIVGKNIGGKYKKVADPEVIRALPLALCMPAYSFIMQMNTPTKATEKNSVSG